MNYKSMFLQSFEVLLKVKLSFFEKRQKFLYLTSLEPLTFWNIADGILESLSMQ